MDLRSGMVGTRSTASLFVRNGDAVERVPTMFRVPGQQNPGPSRPVGARNVSSSPEAGWFTVNSAACR